MRNPTRGAVHHMSVIVVTRRTKPAHISLQDKNIRAAMVCCTDGCISILRLPMITNE